MCPNSKISSEVLSKLIVENEEKIALHSRERDYILKVVHLGQATIDDAAREVKEKISAIRAFSSI